jgi:hypothetical protein
MVMFNSGSKNQSSYIESLKLTNTYRRFAVLTSVIAESDKTRDKGVVTIRRIFTNVPSGIVSSESVCNSDLVFLAERGYVVMNIFENIRMYKPTPKGLKYYSSNAKIVSATLTSLDTFEKNLKDLE